MLWDKVCDLFIDPSTLESFKLEAIEPLLCAAFESKHRHIVNTASLMWNRVFDQASSIEYPEKLKAILVSIQPHVDIVLPGLDVSSAEPENSRPPFLDSQDEFDMSSSFSIAYQNTPQPEPPSSSVRSTPTGSVQLSLPKRRITKRTPKSSKGGSTPRIRHDDSQVHFAAVESSPLARGAESQVLTDRQREVRERQRETATLFPEIRSSPSKVVSVSDLDLPEPAVEGSQAGGLQQAEATTPQTKHRYEGYVSSTPTPRRGQASIIDEDHEMTDEVPSSPPDPRRNLLLEMKPRSRSGSAADNFPITSSPVAGSPLSERWNLARLSASQEQIAPSKRSQEEPVDQGEGTTDIIKDGQPAPVARVSDKPGAPMTNQEDTLNQGDEIDGSRNQQLKPLPTASLLEEAENTSNLDNGSFVDAPSTPVTRASLKRRSTSTMRSTKTRKRARAENHDQSFELSDGEERSMTRLIIELDSRKCDQLPTYKGESPDKTRAQAGNSAVDCITVVGKDNPTPSRSQPRRTRSSGPVSPIAQSDVEKTPTSNKKSKKKRKRSTEAGEDPVSSGKKRREHRNNEPEDEVTSPAFDSQLASFEQLSSQQPAPTPEVDPDETMETTMMAESSDIPPPSSSIQLTVGTEKEQGTSPGSPDSLDTEGEADAVDLQLWTEASQEAESLRHSQIVPCAEEAASVPAKVEEQEGGAKEEARDPDAEMTMMEDEATTELEIMVPQAVEEEEERQEEEASAPAAAPAQELSAAEKIMGALRGGLEGLRAAPGLSRDEVHRIEDVFMDIKRELYNAESRGRRT